MEDKITLVGQMVKTIDSSEGIDVTSIIPFMYPNFVIRDEISFDYENDVIYTGPYARGIKDILSHGTKSFIAITNMGIQDFDLTNRDTSIKILYSKWGKTPSESVKNALDSMNEQEYWKYFKTFWVTGRSSIEDSKLSLFNLYMVLGKQRHDILQCYFSLREVFSDSAIFSGLLSFLEKSIDLDNVSSQNGRYLNLLKAFKGEYGNLIVPVIQRAYIMPCETEYDREYRTLWTLMQFGKGAAI